MMKTQTKFSGQHVFVLLSLRSARLDNQIMELCLPEDNFIATNILGVLLNSLLENAGESMSPVHAGGGLNESVFVCHVRDAHAAVKIISAALEKLKLNGVAQIYRFDEDEGIYRCLFPVSGNDIQFPEMMQRAKDAVISVDLLGHKLAALDKLVGQFPKPPEPPK